MWEPPSQSLRTQLNDLNICSCSDLRRCRRFVRRLARDLPTFDSVWLDALVQAGRITPFQARRLEEDCPALRVGPCVIVERLGAGPLGETFLARSRPGGAMCVLKLLHPPMATIENEQRLSDLVARLSGVSHPSLAIPQACEHADGRLVLVSRHVVGLHLAELLVRRGRFPAAIVWEIGRQLAQALAILESHDVAHGDVRLANVRLASDGIAVLVDAGVRAILDPSVGVQARVSPDRYDGLAPELIGSNRAPDATSDRYALGCLLWQLLAGRPPFPGGDPLIKLAAHRNRRVDDVRKWAPDVPDALAEGVWRLTAPDPGERISSFDDLLALWRPPTRAGRRRLASFRQWFDRPAGNIPDKSRATPARRPALVLSALAVAVCGLALLSQRDTQGVLLSWGAAIPQIGAGVDRLFDKPAPDESDEGPNPSASHAEFADAALLPLPDPSGTIRLEGPGPYSARALRVVGGLQIVGRRDQPAEIVVGDASWTIAAETVRFESVAVRRQRSMQAGPASDHPLLKIDSQQIDFEHCRVEAEDFAAVRAAVENSLAASPKPPAVVWRMVDPADLRGGRVRWRDCVFVGHGASLRAADAPRQIDISNCLRLGPGPLVDLSAAPRARSVVTVYLQHTTCRAGDAVLRLAPPADTDPRGGVLLESHDSVLDLGRQGAVIEVVCRRQNLAGWLNRLRIAGAGSVTPPELAVVSHREHGSAAPVPCDASTLSVEGLVAGSYEYAGGFSRQVAHAELSDCEAPRHSPQLPGIDAARLIDTAE